MPNCYKVCQIFVSHAFFLAKLRPYGQMHLKNTLNWSAFHISSDIRVRFSSFFAYYLDIFRVKDVEREHCSKSMIPTQ